MPRPNRKVNPVPVPVPTYPADKIWRRVPPVTTAPEGSFNFRDLGDYRTTDAGVVRQGLVYRSGDLEYVTPAGWEAITCLGVRTMFDLRADHERGGGQSGAERTGIEVVRIPMWEDGKPGTTLSDRVPSAAFTTPEQFIGAYAAAKVKTYAAMVSAYAYASGFGSVVDGLSRPECLPAVLHCSAGKDRTGLASAILLCLLGVSEADALADYVRSRDGISAPRLDRYRAGLERLGVPLEQFAPVYAAHPPALIAALDAMTAGWGSVEGYLAGAGGMAPCVPGDLRAHLVVP